MSPVDFLFMDLDAIYFLFYFFISGLIDLARTSSTMLNISGVSEHSHFVPVVRKKVLIFPH